MVPAYDATQYPAFAVAVDLVVLTVRDDALQALLVRRGEAPQAGWLALPGGFVQPHESLDDAARRELAEETGLDLATAGPPRAQAYLEQLACYGDPDRDPRLRVVSAAYVALVPDLPEPRPGGDADQTAFVPVAPLLADPQRLAFDHGRILADGVERVRAKLEYTTLAARFCPPRFTVAQLRRVYDLVWGSELDARNFHRKATGAPGFLEPVAERTASAGAGRPAQLFRAGPATALHPPILRPSRGDPPVVAGSGEPIPGDSRQDARLG